MDALNKRPDFVRWLRVKLKRDSPPVFHPEFWDNKANIYSGWAVAMWPNHHLNALYHEEMIQTLDQHIPSLAHSDVLELGCGTGRLMKALHTRGARVTGVDFSAKSLEKAQRYLPKSDTVTYRCGSLFDVKDTNAFDLVITWGVLTLACQTPHDLIRALRIAHRALREDGVLYLQEPIHTGFLARALHMSRERFIDLIRQEGFQIAATGSLHFWPIRVALSYVQTPPAVTMLGYEMGRCITSQTQNLAWGDYTLIYAKKVT